VNRWRDVFTRQDRGLIEGWVEAKSKHNERDGSKNGRDQGDFFGRDTRGKRYQLFAETLI
jgi:hypothetical protein